MKTLDLSTASEQCLIYWLFADLKKSSPSLNLCKKMFRNSINSNDAIWLFSVDGISLNLSQEEKRRIEGSFDNWWLSDTILRQQFPYDEGMQSVLYASKPEFQPVSGRFCFFSTDHSIHGPFHSRTNPFTYHPIHGPKSNYIHGPFHSWTLNANNHHSWTIPFTDKPIKC